MNIASKAKRHMSVAYYNGFIDATTQEESHKDDKVVIEM